MKARHTSFYHDKIIFDLHLIFDAGTGLNEPL